MPKMNPNTAETLTPKTGKREPHQNHQLGRVSNELLGGGITLRLVILLNYEAYIVYACTLYFFNLLVIILHCSQGFLHNTMKHV